MGKTLCIVHAPQDSSAAATLKKHMTMSIRNGLFRLVDDVADARTDEQWAVIAAEMRQIGMSS